MTVRELMSTKVISIDQNEPVSAAAKLLKRCNIGALHVCDRENRLRGIITDRDIVVRCVAADLEPGETKISEIMSRGIVTAGPADDVSAAVQLMGSDQVRRLPVLEEGRIVGMVTLCDLARSVGCDMEAGAALSEISANFRRA